KSRYDLRKTATTPFWRFMTGSGLSYYTGYRRDASRCGFPENRGGTPPPPRKQIKGLDAPEKQKTPVSRGSLYWITRRDDACAFPAVIPDLFGRGRSLGLRLGDVHLLL